MKKITDEISGSWIESVKKPKGHFCAHGLYKLIETFQDAPFFAKYILKFKQSSNPDGTPRNFVMIELPRQGDVERHISIEAVFTRDSIHLSPYHLTRIHPFEEYTCIEHAYMVFDESPTGALEWSVNGVTAYKRYNSTRENIILSTHKERNIRQEAVTDVRPVLQDLQRFKDQCMRELGAELSVVEEKLSGQWTIFYSPTTLTLPVIGDLRDLIVQKKNVLEKIHLFSNHVMKHNQGRDKPQECRQVPFLNAMIKKLEDRSQEMEKTVKRPQVDTQDLNNNLKAPSAVLTKKSKKQVRAQKSNASSMSQEGMCAALKALLQEILSCKQIDLASLNEKCLILTEDYERLKRSNDIDQLFKKCDQLLAKREILFNGKMRNTEKLILNVQNLLEQLNEKNNAYLQHMEKIRSVIRSLRWHEMESPGTESNDSYVLSDAVKELCHTAIPLIELTLKAEQDLLELRLDDTVLLPEMQKIKLLILNSDIRDKINRLRLLFPFWFHSAMVGTSVEALATLYQASPATFNQMGNCDSSRDAYHEFFDRILHLSLVPSWRMSETGKENLKNHILVADFLYENQANYQHFFQKYAMKLHSVTGANSKAGIVAIAIKHAHFDLVKMLLRQGLPPEAIHYDNGTHGFNLNQYVDMLKSSSELEDGEYLSLVKLIRGPDNALLKKQLPMFFSYGSSGVPKEMGFGELLSPDNTLIKRQFTQVFFNLISRALSHPIVLAIVLSYFLERLCPSDSVSSQNGALPAPGM